MQKIIRNIRLGGIFVLFIISLGIKAQVTCTLAISPTSTTICSGACVNLTATVNTGGWNPVYPSYQWSNGASTAAVTVCPTVTTIYTVTYYDSFWPTQCFATVQVTVNNELTPVASFQPATCGQSNGAATVSVSGSAGPFQYSWSPSGGNQSTASNLSPGSYTVTVTNASSCSASTSVTITQTPGLLLNMSANAANCNGVANGNATVSVSGGTPAYTYSWSPVAGNTASVGNLPAGTYTVKVTDASNCTASSTALITQPNALIVNTLGITHASCNSLGSASVSASGGTSPFVYTWNTTPVQSSATATGLSSGSYIVTVNDANNCATTKSITITSSTNISLSINSITHVSCNGQNSGSTQISVSGGSGTYNYLWNTTPAQSTPNATNLLAGSYIITVSDASSCSATLGVTITQPPLLTVVSSSTSAGSCNGTGNASVTANGGTPAYTYQWSVIGSTTSSVSSLNAGSYLVTVKDAYNCSASSTVTITSANGPAAGINSITHVTCFGATNGIAQVTASGGTGTYSYSWNTTPVKNSPNATGLSAGNYVVTVKDGNNCSVFVSVTITQPSTALTLTITASNGSSCSTSGNGGATVSANGGTPGYSYSWLAIGSTTATVNNLNAGTYTVNVSDANGCSVSGTVTITQTTLPNVSISQNIPVACAGKNNGSLTATATGGTGTYVYTWNTSPIQSGISISNLSPGVYKVTVTDANNCTATTAATITETAPIVITPSVTSVSCNGATPGSISVTVSGGTPGYTYLWNTSQTSPTISNLGPGTYSLTVTDAMACSQKITATVLPASPIKSISSSDVKCFSGSDGKAWVTPEGPINNYVYDWQPVGSANDTIFNLKPGTYTITVKNNSGCSGSTTVVVNQPSAITGTISSTTNSCNGSAQQSATITVSGGTQPYSYLWNDPVAQTTATATGLVPKNYTVKVTDKNKCEFFQNIQITDPPPIVFSNPKITDETCGSSNGKITITVVGGTPPLQFKWSDPLGQTTSEATGLKAGTYTISVIDANGCTNKTTAVIKNLSSAPIPSILSITHLTCHGSKLGAIVANVNSVNGPLVYNWSPGAYSTNAINNLNAGTYKLIVTDVNSCSATISATITQPPAISISITTIPASCGSTVGAASSSVSGGTGSYTYLWSPGNASTSAVNNLIPGTYTLTVTDASNCSNSAIAAVTNALNIILSKHNVQAVSCKGLTDGSATVSANGGAGPFSYLWSPGGYSTSSQLNLAPADYTVTVKDKNNCSATISITISEPLAITLNANKTDISCKGSNDGTISVAINGGTPGYTYSWSSGQNTSAINNLPTGNYCLTVTDSKSCSSSNCFTISEPALVLTVSVSTSSLTCANSNIGQIAASATGGTAPYSYTWSNGANTSKLNNLSAGTYTLVLNDIKGCSTQATATISAPSPITIATTSTGTSCGANDGTASATASGGIAPYTYSWSNGISAASISNLSNGNYIITVKDNNGCSNTAAVSITQNSVLSVTFAVSHISCNGNTNGTISANVTGGNGTLSYNWAPGGNTSNGLSNVNAGTYTLTVSDNSGCTITSTVTLTEPPALTLTTSKLDNLCAGTSIGTATVTATGGTPAYTYSWSNGNNSSSINNLSAGTYSVVVIDANACSATNAITITQAPPIAISNTVTPVTCKGGSNGTVTVNPSGGNLPYTYTWAPGGYSSSAVFNLSAGIYCLSLQDAQGCTASSCITISEPALAITTTTSATSPTCNEGANGSMNVVASNGTSPYSYFWSNGASTASATSVSKGTYTVIVTDSKGCSSSTTVTVTAPPKIIINFTKQNTICGLQTGSITITGATNGTAPYTYIMAGATQSTLSNLGAATYTFSATDINGCKRDTSVTLVDTNTVAATVTYTPVSCNGLSDAQATVSTTGGTGIYTYQWSPIGSTTSTVYNLQKGTYQVVVSDNNSCSQLLNVTISEPNLLSINPQITPISCFGNTNAVITAIVSGGTAPFTYTWSSGGQTTASIQNLATGTYSVVVTDINGCSSSAQASITEPSALVILSSGSADETCRNAKNGKAWVKLSGGTPSYSYSWTPTQINADSVTALSPGTYTVIAYDQRNCTVSQSFSITPANPIIVVSAVANSNCLSDDGSISITASGGTGSFNYLWTPVGSTTNSIGNLAPGTYTVNVKDNILSCDTTLLFTITRPQVTLSVAYNHVSCSGMSDGEITVSAVGGSGIYSYTWTPGALSTSSVSGLNPGTYSVIVADNTGCQNTASISITSPSAITTSITTKHVSCKNFSDGMISATSSGGSGGYIYQWSTLATTPDISGLSAGSYTLIVTDNNGCNWKGAISVTEPPGMLTIMGSDPVSCFGGKDGIAWVNVNGGNGPYIYKWIPGTASTDTVTALNAGNYTVIITDANGCSMEDSVTVLQATPVNITVTKGNTACGDNTGWAKATATGGNGNYIFVWKPGGQLADSIYNIGEGTYTVIATDSKNCTSSQQVTVGVNNPVVPTFTAVHVSCNGGNNGSISVSASGGVGPYGYLWKPTNATNPFITALTAGDYTLTLTDLGNTICATTAVISITEPAAMNISSLSTPVSCKGQNDGSISITAQGGSFPYTYQWSNNSSSSSIGQLIAGSYTVVVNDSNSCSLSQAIYVTEPPALAVAVSAQSAECSEGGAAYVTANGGVLPYTYQWQPSGATTDTLKSLSPGVYHVTVKDKNGCTQKDSVLVRDTVLMSLAVIKKNISCYGAGNGELEVNVINGSGAYGYLWSPSGETNSKITQLLKGKYIVTVTDITRPACVIKDSATITEPDSLYLNTNSQQLNCDGVNNHKIITTAGGGVQPYEYLWTNGATTSILNNVSPGTYIVAVTDNNNCQNFKTVLVKDAPPPIISNPLVTAATCNTPSGSITIHIFAGTKPFQINWNMPGVPSDTLVDNLAPGTYTVSVKDSLGCEDTRAITVGNVIIYPKAIIIDSLQVSCFGLNNGSAAVSAISGKAPYSYQWLPTGGTTVQANNLYAGSYTVAVTDQTGCSQGISVTITQPDDILSTVTSQSTNCYGSSDGMATVSSIGGHAPYTYLWLPLNVSGTAVSNIAAGNYSVVTTDTSGCTDTLAWTLDQPPPLVSTFSVTPATCGYANGNIALTTSGGMAPYSYQWNNGNSGSSLSNVGMGNYVVTIRDQNNCSQRDTVQINNIGGPSIAVEENIPVSCYNQNDGSITVTTAGGTPAFDYVWSHNGSHANVISNLSSGSYTISVNDANSCSSFAVITITQPDSLSANLKTSHVLCFGAGNGSINVSVAGGTFPYNYLWSHNSNLNNPLASPLIPGSYSVTVTDKNACSFIATYDISEPSPLSITDSITVSGCTVFNGSISITASGGTTPYLYAWNNGKNGSVINTIPAGEYVLTLSDSNGCSRIDTFQVLQADPPILSIDTIIPVSCQGLSDGSVVATATGGTAPYSYLWIGAAGNSSVASNLQAGNYPVIVYDINGCADSTLAIVTEPTLLEITNIFPSPAFCLGDNQGSAGVSTSGGTVPYSYLWTNSSESTSMITITTAGNYEVTVSDGNQCSVKTSLTVYALPNLSMTPLTICAGNPATLSSKGADTYIWSTGITGNPILVYPFVNTTYTVVGIDKHKCSNMDSVKVIVVEKPVADFDMDPMEADEIDPLIHFNNLSTHSSLYHWEFGDGDTSNTINPAHSFPKIGHYKICLTASNSGCGDEICKQVKIIPVWTFYIPNSFTPNGDGINDTFIGVGYNITEFHMQIYDRWGMLVFQSDSLDNAWNGAFNNGSGMEKSAQQDVYTYKMQVTDVFGNTHDYIGTVTLIGNK